MKMFTWKTKEVNPTALKKTNLPHNDFRMEEVSLKGIFYRVIPSTAREIFFLQTLNKGSTIHAPANGDGVLVRSDVIDFLN